METNGKKEITELRRRRILEELRRRGAVRTAELARYFAVSPMTIRNDLATLAERGLVERVHGGAMLKSPLANEPSYFEKTQLNLTEKQAIGRKAASLIEEGMVLFIGNGTTTMQIVQALKNNPTRRLKIFTNALTHAMELAEIPDAEVYVIGGYLRGVSYAMVGPLAHQALENAYFDRAFFGANGISLAHGITIPSLEEADTAAEVVRRAREVVVVADHTKLGAVAHAKIADLGQVHILITDAQAPSPVLQELTAAGVHVLIAEEGG